MQWFRVGVSTVGVSQFRGFRDFIFSALTTRTVQAKLVSRGQPKNSSQYEENRGGPPEFGFFLFWSSFGLIAVEDVRS